MAQLTAAQLFTPAPSGVGPFGNVPLVPPAGTWLSVQLNIANQVKLPTTSWQPGAPERTILSIESVCFAQSDVNISIMAQGGFLQTAASGTVTYVTNNGTQVTIPVTPDPSNTAQNPTGALGWLDILCQNVYEVTRLSATAASGPLAIANISTFTRGPYASGTYHVANSQSGTTYSNPSPLTIPSSIIAGTGGTVAGVSPGLTFSIITTASAHGLTVGQSVYLVIPISSGITGLNGAFALVTAVTTNTFQISTSSSGMWTAGGTVYLCTVAQMNADTVGIASNAAPGTVTTTVTQNTGVFTSNIVGWSGSNWESNTALAGRAQNSLAAASPNGPSQAYIYFGDTAQQLLLAQSPPYILTNGPVVANEFATPATGIVTTVVASVTPASTTLGAAVTPGVSQLAIFGVSNANPAVVTCAAATTLLPGQSMTVTITGVLNMAGVNGTFLGTYVGSNSFSIPVNTLADGTYGGGGSVEGGDLGQIDRLIQTRVVPDNTTAVTVSALALPITIVATVVVPQAYVQTYNLAYLPQLQAQIASYAVGGNAPDFAVAYNDIVGALEEAGVLVLGTASYVREVQNLSINGGAVGVGVPFPSSIYQAILATPTVTVLGV
jgi:hypothetical protein